MFTKHVLLFSELDGYRFMYTSQPYEVSRQRIGEMESLRTLTGVTPASKSQARVQVQAARFGAKVLNTVLPPSPGPTVCAWPRVR